MSVMTVSRHCNIGDEDMSKSNKGNQSLALENLAITWNIQNFEAVRHEQELYIVLGPSFFVSSFCSSFFDLSLDLTIVSVVRRSWWRSQHNNPDPRRLRTK